MGCGPSLPKADKFLANEQPAPASCLHDGMPTEGVTMQAWSNFDPGNRYHSGGGALGALQTIQVAFREHVDEDQAWHNGSTLSDAVGDAGVGAPEHLAITAAGAQIATMSMPPHMAFGIAAVLRDSAGKVIALIATAQTTRPSGMSTSSVNVWGIKPIAGQAPTAVGGINGYLWARAERKPFSNTFTIYNAANEPVAKGTPTRGFASQYKVESAGGQGLMLASFTAGSNKKSFDIQCAKGVDVALAICWMAALQVGRDELRVDASEGPGGGPGDD